MRNTIKDTDWVRQSFLLPTNGIDETLDAVRRVYTTANFKYTDTTIGGNFPLNSLPQFTRYADLKRFNQYKTSKGMGRFYSEVIDDNAQLIHLRLGVPKFNSLTRFFGDFYSVEASTLARTGRSTSVFFEIGALAGSVVTVGLTPFLAAGKAFRFFVNKPASRYYYLKPTMPLYWNAVSTMVNTIAVNMGVIPRIGSNDQKEFQDGVEWTQSDIDKLRNLLPGVIRKDGGIDIYAVSTRAQRLANAFNDALENSMSGWANGNKAKLMQEKVANWSPTPTDGGVKMPSQKEYLAKFFKSPDGEFERDSTPASTETDNREQSVVDRMVEFFHGERMMGADFVTFRVDHTGSTSESFSNGTKPPGIADTINSQSSSAREARFNVADGNISDGILGKAVGGFLNAAKETMMGVADSLSIGGIATLAGSAFVDIPDTWDSSTADVGRSTFTIPLRAPYGHDYSRLQNLVIPMAALLAMALPLSTGKQSYTSPFILELYNRGRTQVRLGMVESLTFTRGVGETGWIKDGKYMGVDCNLTIIDLSKVVHMPITAAFGIGRGTAMAAASLVGKAIEGSASVVGASVNGTVGAQAVAAALMPSSYDDDNKYSDYMAVLGSLPMEAQINTFRKFKLRLTQQSAAFEAWSSPAHLMNYFMGSMGGDLIKAVSTATSRGF